MKERKEGREGEKIKKEGGRKNLTAAAQVAAEAQSQSPATGAAG